MQDVLQHSEREKRPLVITITCVLMAVSLGLYLVSLPLTFSTILQKLGAVHVGFSFVSTAIAIYSLWLIWRMERKGVYLYLALGLIGTILSARTVDSSSSPIYLLSILFQGIIAVIFLHFLNRMNPKRAVEMETKSGDETYTAVSYVLLVCLYFCLVYAIVDLFVWKS